MVMVHGDLTLRRLAFQVCICVISPFIFFGAMIMMLGTNFGDRIVGIVMLAMLLPVPIRLSRRAHPKAARTQPLE